MGTYKDNTKDGGDGKFHCLVTGAAGFIGHHLTRALNDKGFHVIPLDNMASGTIENLNYAGSNGFAKIDIRNANEIEAFFQSQRIDFVFHLAALPRVQYSIAEPLLTNDVNITGTLNLLNAARKNGVKRFIYSSSSSLYGNQATLPLHEGMTPNPLSPYATQKLTGEYYTRQFYSVYGLPTVSLRYFNVYGPRQRADSDYSAAIPKFTKQILDGKNPTVYGDGEQTRDFTFVRDVVRANIASAFVDNPAAFGQAFNIGGGERVSVNNIINQIAKTLGKDVDIDYLPPVIESKHTLADISKAKTMIGWQPFTSFADGLRLTIESMKEAFNGNS